MPRKPRILTKDRLLEAKCFSENYLGSFESSGANRELLISLWVAVSRTEPTLPPVIPLQGIPGAAVLAGESGSPGTEMQWVQRWTQTQLSLCIDLSPAAL